ncbi:MAG: NHL repeat-containing protein [Coriobacteriia bacterium]
MTRRRLALTLVVTVALLAALAAPAGAAQVAPKTVSFSVVRSIAIPGANSMFTRARPDDVAVGPDGNIYVVCENDQYVRVFSPSGASVRSWRFTTTANITLGDVGIDVGPDGNVYVADSWEYMIKVFTRTGTFIRQFGSQGYGNGQFDRPLDVKVTPDRSIVVADTWGGRIQIFNSDGTFSSVLPVAGQMSHPTGIDVDARGHIYVADESWLNRIEEFRDDGSLVATYGPQVDSFRFPQGVTVDANGNVFVADPGNHRVWAFDSSGAQQAVYTVPTPTGTGASASSPSKLDVDPSTGLLYVIDHDNPRVVVLATGTGTSLSMSASTVSLPYAGGTATLSGRLRTTSGTAIAGRSVAVQTSTDRSDWGLLGVYTTDASGAFRASLQVTSGSYVRAFFAGEGLALRASASTPLLVRPRAALGAPVVPSSTGVRRAFTAYGTIRPHQTAGSRNVTLRLQRLVSGRWVAAGTATAVNSDSGGATRYTGRFTPAYRGTHRVVASYAGSVAYGPASATSRTFLVR